MSFALSNNVLASRFFCSCTRNCKQTRLVAAKTEMLPSTAEALHGESPTIINIPRNLCTTPACINAASEIINNMNSSVNPCDDFYRFACGTFLHKTSIPDDKVSVNTFSVISDQVQEQLKKSIGEPIMPDDTKPIKLVKNLYKSCMDKKAIEDQGVEPLLKILKKLGGWPVLEGDKWDENNFNWIESVYKFRDEGYSVDYFFDFSIGVDLKNSTKRVIDLDQPSLGLSREFLVEGMNDKIVKAYYKYMIDIAVILGAPKEVAKKEMTESLEFEKALANISLPKEKRRNVTLLYNPMTLMELTKNFPSVPWKEYFNRLLAPKVSVDDNEIVIVNVPSYISEFSKLISKTPRRIQANYAMWRAASASVSYLNEDIRKRQLEYATELSGKTEREARWKECIDIVAGSLSLSVGSLYIKKYFDGEAKKNAVEMVDDIRMKFNDILKKVDWMDEKTRKSALDKAASMVSHIAYPDELLDDKKLEDFYSGLELTGDNYLKSILNLTMFGTEYLFGELRKPINKSDWKNHGRSAIVNAFYSSIENSIRDCLKT
ncbi:hypothetical protein PV325_007594 [Microctonus aethiopoides]|nr:hypothetical protein PV325_007594 [Microctonus aethiopoides]